MGGYWSDTKLDSETAYHAELFVAASYVDLFLKRHRLIGVYPIRFEVYGWLRTLSYTDKHGECKIIKEYRSIEIDSQRLHPESPFRSNWLKREYALDLDTLVVALMKKGDIFTAVVGEKESKELVWNEKELVKHVLDMCDPLAPFIVWLRVFVDADFDYIHDDDEESVECVLKVEGDYKCDVSLHVRVTKYSKINDAFLRYYAKEHDEGYESDDDPRDFVSGDTMHYAEEDILKIQVIQSNKEVLNEIFHQYIFDGSGEYTSHDPTALLIERFRVLCYVLCHDGATVTSLVS